MLKEQLPKNQIDCIYKNGDKNGNGRIEKKNKGAEKINRCGYLGLTCDDHKDLGSTPEQILKENPGKTLGELLSHKEIEDYLDQEIKGAEESKKRLGENDDGATDKTIIINALRDFKGNFMRDLNYLRSIGKLPEKYQSFNSE